MIFSFQERCPASQGSASTESYCDISDSPSSVSELNLSTKKRVSKKPMLPAWQRECLKNYDQKQCDFTKSENHLSKSCDTAMTCGHAGTRYAASAQHREAFRSSDRMESNEESFNWEDALSSCRKDRIVYEDRCDFDFDAELRRNRFEIGLSDDCSEDDVNASSPPFSGSDCKSSPSASPLPSKPLNRAVAQSSTEEFDKDLGPCFEKESANAKDENISKFSSQKSSKLDSAHKNNRSFDFPKSKLRGHGSSGGLLQAVAFFEKLDKENSLENKIKKSSLRSFKVGESSANKSYDSQPPLTVSPFQLDISARSDKCLRDLERRAESQFVDMKEKLGDSSLESIDMVKVVPRAPLKLDELSISDSGYSTTARIRTKKEGKGRETAEKALAASKAKSGTKATGDDGLDFVSNSRTTTHRIVVTKNEHDKDFGFSISERVNGRGIYVKSIQASTGRSGKLKKYDRLLQVRFELYFLLVCSLWRSTRLSF